MNTRKIQHFGFEIEYYESDMMGRGSVGEGKKWEPHILEFTKFFKNNFKLSNIIDVGANFGYHTLFFSKEASKDVFSFEPQPQNLQLLKNNIKNNNISNVKIFPFAVSDNENPIYIPVIDDNTTITNMGDITLQNNKTNNNVKVVSVLLDRIPIFEIDLIKIDVQGWELNVLRGATNTIKRDKPILLIEFEIDQFVKTNTTCEQVANFIRELGYYIFYLDYEYESDHICVHNDKLDRFMEVFKDKIHDHSRYNYVNENINFGVNKKIVMEYDHYK